MKNAKNAKWYLFFLMPLDERLHDISGWYYWALSGRKTRWPDRPQLQFEAPNYPQAPRPYIQLHGHGTFAVPNPLSTQV